MTFAIVVSNAAKQELAQSYEWYKTRSSSAAKAFRAEVLATFDLIAEDPQKWAIHDDPIRRSALKQYPYTIYFSIVSDQIQILAVGHHRRRVNYWKNS